MKKFFLFAALIFVSVSSFAKIWRVNNNVGVTANFTSLQAAHDGAAAGDTLYLESSPTSYGAVTCSKKLYIIGTGYFLDQNLNLQAFTLPSKVDQIYLNAGSTGSVVEGLSFNGSGVSISVSDVVIRRNNFASANGTTADYSTGAVNINSPSSNILITQNYGLTISNNGTSTGILITNNYLAYHGYAGETTAGTFLQLSATTVAIVKNNIFRRGTVTTYNTNLSNNIMYAGFFTGTGNLVSNNLASGTQFGTADGNQANVTMANVFIATGTSDNYFQLKPGSPAIGAGFGSTALNPVDAGMYGGSTPYVLSGMPAIPSIYFFTNQPVGSNSSPISVQIKVRSNN